MASDRLGPSHPSTRVSCRLYRSVGGMHLIPRLQGGVPLRAVAPVATQPHVVSIAVSAVAAAKAGPETPVSAAGTTLHHHKGKDATEGGSGAAKGKDKAEKAKDKVEKVYRARVVKTSNFSNSKRR